MIAYVSKMGQNQRYVSPVRQVAVPGAKSASYCVTDISEKDRPKRQQRGTLLTTWQRLPCGQTEGERRRPDSVEDLDDDEDDEQLWGRTSSRLKHSALMSASAAGTTAYTRMRDNQSPACDQTRLQNSGVTGPKLIKPLTDRRSLVVLTRVKGKKG